MLIKTASVEPDQVVWLVTRQLTPTVVLPQINIGATSLISVEIDTPTLRSQCRNRFARVRNIYLPTVRNRLKFIIRYLIFIGKDYAIRSF